jgi:hypothetical protein
MLEIFGLIALCKSIGGILERKGRRSGWFKFLVVIAWFGGEFAGAILAAIVAVIVNPQREPPMGAIYITALVSAALSVGLVFLIASLLSDLRPLRAALEPALAPPSGPTFLNHTGAPLPADANNPYRAPSFPER